MQPVNTKLVFIFHLLASCVLLSSYAPNDLRAQDHETELTLDFQVIGMHVGPDQKQAIAWGPKIKKGADMGFSKSHNHGPDEVAILDLESQKVVAQKSFSTGVQSAIMGKRYIYLLTKPGNLLQQFGATTLKKRKRTFLKENGSYVVPFTDEQIGVCSTQTGYPKIQLVNSSTMKLDKVFKVRDWGGEQRVTAQVEPGIFSCGSRFINIDDGSVAMLTANPNLNLLIPRRPSSGLQSPRPPRVFGRYIDKNSIRSTPTSEIAKFNSHNKEISPTGATVRVSGRMAFTSHFHPAAFLIYQKSEPSSRGFQAKFYLDTINLVDGEILDSQVFAVVTRNRVIHSNDGIAFGLNDKVVYSRGNQVHVIPINLDKIAAAPKPLHFKIPQIPILNAKKRQTISFNASGGTGELEYQLAFKYDGIEIDSASGEMTIDTPTIWKNYLKENTPPSKSFRRNYHRRNPKSLSAEYENMFNVPIPAGKIPFAIPINVSVTDSEAQNDQLTAFAVVLGDKSSIDKMEAKQRAFIETAQKEYAAKKKAAQEQARAELERSRSGRAQGLPAESDEESIRLNRLENQMSRMEDKLDRILKEIKN